MENFSQFAIAGLRNAITNIVGRKTGQQAANRNKLDTGIIDIDNDAAAIAVVTMDKCIEQCLSQSIFGIIRKLHSFQTLECGSGAIAERQIRIAVIQLFEDGTAKLLCVFKGNILFITKHGNFGRVLALV